MKLVHKNERHGSTPALSKLSCLSQSSSPAPRHIPAHWFALELGQTSSAWITYGSMTQFIQALLDKIYTVGSLLTVFHWFSLICQRGCWAGNSVNLNLSRDRLKGAGLKNRQVSIHLLNKDKNPPALIGAIGWGGNCGWSGWDGQCSLQGQRDVTCTHGPTHTLHSLHSPRVPAHLPTHLQSISALSPSSAHAVSSQGTHGDTAGC